MANVGPVIYTLMYIWLRATKFVTTTTITETHLAQGSVIFVNENENENYQKRKNNDFVNEN